MIVKEIPEEAYGEGLHGAPAPKVPTVKEQDIDSQPREKAVKNGIHTLSEAELLAIILRTGTPGYPVTSLCRDLMKYNDGTLHNLERRSRGELMKLRGIGMTKAIQIEAVMEIVRRYMGETAIENPSIRQSGDIASIMRPKIGNLPHEEIWVLFLSRSNKVIKLYQVSKGGLAASLFDVRMVLKEALLENASALVLCHNHPSGTLQPSTADDRITRQCKEACQTVDIRMFDHIIITADSYYSYNDNGRL